MPPSLEELCRGTASSSAGQPVAKVASTEVVVAQASAEGKLAKEAGIVVVPNPYPRKPIPSKVLTEDDYTDAVSHIIERDFFPDLPHLRIKHEILQARVNGDAALAQDLQWQLVNLSRPTPLSSVAATPGRITPGATPLLDMSGAATPAGATPRMSAWERDDDVESTVAVPSDVPSNARLQLADGKEVVVDLQKVRLDDFHRVFTSEDNAAFEDIVVRDKERLAFKQWWMEDAELVHNTRHQEYRKAIMEGTDMDKNAWMGHGTLLGNEFKARNHFSFKPDTLSVAEVVEKPKVDFKNTRFTTAQQSELDSMLGISVASRRNGLHGDQELEAGERMARSGQFGLGAMLAQGTAAMRSVGGRISTPMLPDQEVRGFGFVSTPVLLPGVGGLSPLMTYGKLGSTPRCLEEDGPVFKMNEKSEREQAAEKLQRGATQKLRETKQHTKAERLRALGLTPPGSCTPGRTPRAATGGASSGRRTPGSVTSAKVTPLSPIGALLQRAKKMSQQGGHLRISSSPLPTHTPLDDVPSSKRRRRASTPDPASLPPSITDDLL